MTITHVGFI